jgi:hypothetical protein
MRTFLQYGALKAEIIAEYSNSKPRTNRKMFLAHVTIFTPHITIFEGHIALSICNFSSQLNLRIRVLVEEQILTHLVRHWPADLREG